MKEDKHIIVFFRIVGCLNDFFRKARRPEFLRGLPSSERKSTDDCINNSLVIFAKPNFPQMDRAVSQSFSVTRLEAINKRASGSKGAEGHVVFMLLTRKVCGGCVAVLKQHLREFVEPQLHVPPFLERRVRRLEAVPLRIARRQHRLHRRGKACEREGARRVVHLFVVELKGFRHPARRRTRRKRSRVIGEDAPGDFLTHRIEGAAGRTRTVPSLDDVAPAFVVVVDRWIGHRGYRYPCRHGPRPLVWLTAFRFA